MPSTSKKSPAPRGGDAAPRGPRKRLALEERREQLIALGIEAFSDRAYDEVSIDAVAAKASISKGLLYHYFPTKRDFYVATIREVARQLLAETEFADEPDPLRRLALGLRAYFGFVRRHAAAYASLLRGGIGADGEAARIVDDTRGTFVERLIESIQLQTVTPLARTTMRGWIGFVEATSLDWVDRRDLHEDELVALWSQVLLTTVTPLLGSRPPA